MLKVVFDHQVFALQKYGGISRCFVELHKHMPDSCTTTIAVHESDNIYVREFDGVKPSGYQFEHFISKTNFRGKSRLHRWFDHLKCHRYYPDYNQNYSIELLKDGQYDVFHPTYFDDYFLPYLNGKPFVLTIHDMIPELYPQYFERNDAQIVMRKKLAPLASAIIAVSENTKRDVIKILGVPEEKIHVVYHGCSFPSTGSQSLYPFPYILFVGERGLYKNFSLFVRSVTPVLEKHKDIAVICTGKPFSQKEQELLRDYGVGDRFYHHWVETDSDLYSLYHYAQCFVYPSEYEGFGIPILEAYQAECPVILNHASCFPEIAGDSALYFTNEEELTAQIEHLLDMSSNERDTLLSQQKERLAMYSWGKSARQLATIYQSLC